MSKNAEVVPTDGDHVVQLYERDEDLAGVVGGYLAASALYGDTVIVFAVPEHRRLFRMALATAGVDVDRGVADGRLMLVDAQEVLDRLMAAGSLDLAAFEETVGALVRRVAAEGAPVRVYGELVAVLWEAGDVAGAIELERLWNGLAADVPFSLFCAYPARLVSDAGSVEAFSEVCRLHSDVISPPAPVATEASRGFAASVEGPRLAREFVSGILRSWGLDDMVEDAEAVVAELATNAVLHAGSDFTVGLSRRNGQVRLEVYDASGDVPEVKVQDHPSVASGGWGLYLVGQIADRWDHSVLEEGKVVWAELPVARSISRDGR